MSKSKDGWDDEEIFSTFGKIFGPGGTFDRIFGSSNRPVRKKETKPVKKSPPKPFTTKLRLIKDSKCPRWADVWVQLLSSTYGVPGLIRPTEEAADAVAMLLEAGWVPPNADKTAFHRWVDNGDPSAYITTTNEPADAEEVTNGSENSQSQEETPSSD